MTQAPAPVFRLALRVYWEDTDAAGIVFYANFLKFFERARTEWLRTKGYSQEQLRTERGTGFIVTDASISYRRPARLDDLLDVTVALTRIGQASLQIAQQASRIVPDGTNELLADGTIRIGCVELGTYRPRRIPTEILQSIQ
ncbi:MAG: tol-pal system-associated acyl-CoA thioesterase [Caldimonas sp.]